MMEALETTSLPTPLCDAMPRNRCCAALLLLATLTLQAGADDGVRPQLGAIECAGRYSKHLQGVCTNQRDAVYWCFTDVLLKTDAQGRVERQVDVANHHGDLCFHQARVYVAVNLGKFNRPAGEADSWVYVYDADSLEELARHPVPEVVHGAGGMAWHDGRFFVVGGLPEGIDENYVYEYDAAFAFQRRHVVASGATYKGIQTAAFADKHWWFGCYGSPRVLLKTDAEFRPVGRYEFDAAYGIVGVGEGKLLVARGECRSGEGCSGRLLVARPEHQHGLRLLPK